MPAPSAHLRHRRSQRRVAPWFGSVVLHAAAILALAMWMFRPESGPGELSLEMEPGLADSMPEVLPPSAEQPLELLDAQSSLAELATTPELSLQEFLAVEDSGRGGIDARFASQGQGDGTGGANFFGSVAAGNRFVFLIDRSGSMGQNSSRRGMSRFERARNELLATIEHLYPDQQFCVIMFSSRSRPMFGWREKDLRLVASDRNHKDQLTKWLEDTRISGGTNPLESITQALALRPDAIFLLSDGEFLVGSHRISALAHIRRQNEHGVPFHTVAFEDKANSQVLYKIAQETGGTYRFVE